MRIGRQIVETFAAWKSSISWGTLTQIRSTGARNVAEPSVQLPVHAIDTALGHGRRIKIKKKH